ncbi:hypothetical protein VNO77_34614 [Canavalia gladiata]|uniref:Uncharacterized protein n=1 Tax=Canavalia gladiata TaxID=3824 RepID=A0AAN9Q1X7_CANGL
MSPILHKPYTPHICCALFLCLKAKTSAWIIKKAFLVGSTILDEEIAVKGSEREKTLAGDAPNDQESIPMSENKGLEGDPCGINFVLAYSTPGPRVFMLYAPSTSFLVLAKAFFRGSSEQYGFLIKVTPPSIMGGERKLSLNDSVCPFLLLFPLLPFLFFLSPYPVPGALLGVAILEVPHLRSLRLLL